jgi:hypothetical protein
MPASGGNGRHLRKFTSILLLFLMMLVHRAAAQTTEQSGGTIKLLNPDRLPGNAPPSLLVRELARQSVLIAARDGLGLYTLDGVMREVDTTPAPLELTVQGSIKGLVPEPSPAAVAAQKALANDKTAIRVSAHVDFGSSTLVVKFNSADANSPAISEDAIAVQVKDNSVDIAALLPEAEARSRGKYMDLLAQNGFSGKANGVCDLDAPAGVDELLYQTTLLSQVAAIQQTHSAIHISGESPARLGALVRGYANLGQLCRFQWNAINKALTARSLLYAQRMVQADTNSPIAYRHRAYALGTARF